MLRALDASAIRRWVALAATSLEREREAVDRINVYPVADGDTGTNLLHTLRAAEEELGAGRARSVDEACSALARGALAGARGNSGMLISQLMRGFAEEIRSSAGEGPDVERSLRRARDLSAEAMAEPVEGTMLTVLAAAADAAAEHPDESLGAVVRRATWAAAEALEKTTAQLPPLAEAGVVDAGGRGIVIVLDALHAVVCDGRRLAPDPPAVGTSPGEHHESRYEYEVMYRVAGAAEAEVARLRERLAELGDCVSVVGDGSGDRAVHVHCDDIGPAVEAGIGAGHVHGIRVVRFADQVSRREGDAVLACARGPALAELFGAEGARVVAVDPEHLPSADDLLDEMAATGAQHVTVLPNDHALTSVAEEAARRSLGAGRDVVVVPTSSPVQGLAALAVRDRDRRRAEDTVAMTEAAAATRRGELTVAEQEALTWAGRCQPGDVLGLVDGEVVLIGADVTSSARALVDRMLTAGGELLTLLVDEGAPESLGADLAEHLRRVHPEVELTCYPGGELGTTLLVGME